MSQNETPDVLDGKLRLCEDTQGVLRWAFQESAKHPAAGIYQIESGDVLMIFNDASRRDTLWSGVLEFDTAASPQVLAGVGCVDAPPAGQAAAVWADYFTAGKPAMLIRRAARMEKRR